jgi:hypothetical protein
VLGHTAEVEDGRLSGHVAVYNTEFLRVGVPANIVNRTLLICRLSVERNK